MNDDRRPAVNSPSLEYIFAAFLPGKASGVSDFGSAGVEIGEITRIATINYQGTSIAGDSISSTRSSARDFFSLQGYKRFIFIGLGPNQKLTNNLPRAHCHPGEVILLCALIREGTVRKSLSFLISAWSLCLLNGCGGGSTPPPVVATHFSVAPSTSSPASGTAFSVTVTALGASGQTATSYSGTVHFSSTDSQAVLPSDTAMASATGTFSVTLNTAGNQKIAVTDAGSNHGLSSAINVGSGTPTHFSVTAASYTATTGTPISIIVTAFDASGNTATGYSGTVHFTSSDGKAVLPANSTLTSGVGNFSATLRTAGGETITATDTVSTSITGMSNAFNVSGPATHFIVASSSTAGTRSPITLLVSALDGSNNVSSGYSGTVRITSSDKNAVLPANGSLAGGQGNFQFTFESSGNQTITATDTVTASITGTSSSVAVTATAALAITSGAPPPGTVGSSYGTTTTQYLKCNFRPPLGERCSPCVPNTAACGGSYPRCPAPVTCVFREVFTGFALTGAGGVPAYSWTGSSLPPGLQ